MDVLVAVNHSSPLHAVYVTVPSSASRIVGDDIACFVLEALLRGMMTSIVLLITAMCKVPGPPSYASSSRLVRGKLWTDSSVKARYAISINYLLLCRQLFPRTNHARPDLHSNNTRELPPNRCNRILPSPNGTTVFLDGTCWG
jgi:hypothetical protein